MNVGEMMKYVQDSKLDAEVILHKGRSGLRSEDAAAILGVGVDKIIKVVLFVDDDKKVLVILQGNQRADLGKLKDFSSLKLAKPDDVKRILGYAPGSIPPICLPADIPKYVDEAVLKQDYVFGSACSEFAGLKINPKEILQHNKNIQHANLGLEPNS